MAAYLLKLKRINLKDLHTKVHTHQRNIIDFIKERRTVKLLHLLRGYSALVVVISSAVLVSATNMAAGKESGGFLFGYWQNDAEQSPQENKVSGQISRRNDLAFVPLAKASTAVDVNFKEEDSGSQDLVQSQAIVMASNAILKDPQEGEGVKIYAVKSGDTISSIAARHNITSNTILWANNIEDVDSIMPGDKIFILPIAGIKYIVQSGDNLEYIAEKYKSAGDKIIAFNDLPANGKVEVGQEIIIPGGQKEISPPSATDASGLARRQYSTPSGGTPSISGWKKPKGKAGKGRRFPYGYCTWYVAQKRYVPWGGNAGAWLYNAKAMGYKTGKTPKKGAIVVTTDNPYYGHVAYIEKVGKGTITVSEMNYVGWGKVNRRTFSTKSRKIKGYIY